MATSLLGNNCRNMTWRLMIMVRWCWDVGRTTLVAV